MLVDGCIAEKPSPEIFTAWSGRMSQLEQNRQKQGDGFVRNMYKKPQAEEYLKRVVSASTQGEVRELQEALECVASVRGAFERDDVFTWPLAKPASYG